MCSRFYQQSSNGKKRGDGGFTLIELLIVVAIIGILATVSLPIYQYFIGKAKVTVAKNTLHTIQTTLESYNTDRGSYPLTIDFSSGLDDIGQIALQPQLREQIATDLFAIDSYVMINRSYTLTARANDTSRTTLIVTPTTIATQD